MNAPCCRYHEGVDTFHTGLDWVPGHLDALVDQPPKPALRGHQVRLVAISLPHNLQGIIKCKHAQGWLQPTHRFDDLEAEFFLHRQLPQRACQPSLPQKRLFDVKCSLQ